MEVGWGGGGGLEGSQVEAIWNMKNTGKLMS